MRRRVAVALLVTGLMAAACGDGGGGDSDRRTLRVAAASSLTEAFTDLATTFEKDHPTIDVVFDFGASSSLARRVNQGDPVDVFASADATSMGDVVDAGNADGAPEVMARNRLSIVVEKGNPKGITSLADLASPGTVLVMCAAEVPCGRLGAAALDRAGVDAKPKSLEENVKAVVAKVRLGEADAGIVYVTDVEAADEAVEGVAIEGADDPALEAVYLIAVTRLAEEREAARDWLDYVFSDVGQRALDGRGFVTT